MIRTISYFIETHRCGLLAYARDGAAIGGFEPGDFGWKDDEVTSTVVDWENGETETFNGYLHPDKVIALSIERWAKGYEEHHNL